MSLAKSAHSGPHVFDQRIGTAAPDAGFKIVINEAAEKSHFTKMFDYFSKYPAKNDYARHSVATRGLKKGAAGTIVIFNREDKVSDVFRILSTEGIFGAPVLNLDGTCAGYVDMLDLTSYAVKLFCGNVRTRSEADWKWFWSEYSTFQAAKISEFGILFRLNKCNVPLVSEDSSLLHVAETMIHDNARRVILVDKWKQVKGYITTSMLISTISQNIDFLGDIGEKRVASVFHELNSWITSCDEHDEAHEAFEKMVSTNHSALPVLNSQGVLVDVLSSRDLRGIGESGEHFRSLWKTVKDFKTEARARFPKKSPNGPYVVTQQTTLKEVLEKMDDGNIHRVFVVDNVGHAAPKRVLGQRDLLRIFIAEYRKRAGAWTESN